MTATQMAGRNGAPANYKELQDRAEEIRERINRLRTGMARFFINRQEVIDLLVVGAVAQEPALLLGPPGTAKSDIIVKFSQALGVPPSDYFEYTLNGFTEPSEILGSIDIAQMREGKYIRQVGGMLPTAKVAFLDEVFRGNSAILNVLLTLMNERKFKQGSEIIPVPLIILNGASNDLPEHENLGAIRDRFILKVHCHPVQEENFDALIDAGLRNEYWKGTGLRPWVEGLCSLDDIVDGYSYLMHQFGQVGRDGTENDRTRYLPAKVGREFQRVVRTLAREDKIEISDRKIAKLYKLMRVRSWLFSGGTIDIPDLALLTYVGNTKAEVEILKEKVPRLLKVGG